MRREAMSIEELEQQLLSLDLAQRIRILQLLAQSLTAPSGLQSSRSPDELDLTRDRSPQHPLRGIPINIPPDFDEPMPELWDALEE
jgi:conjugal transfer/entry exclusion protein